MFFLTIGFLTAAFFQIVFNNSYTNRMKNGSNILTGRLIQVVSQQYALSLNGIHGKFHWARVLDNGLRLARLNGADADVISLFAIFHDSRRMNDARDDQHGERGAILASQLRGTWFMLSDVKFEMLYTACKLHTEGLTEADVTVQTCWDADRLDLGRANIEPDPHYLCTAEAKDPQLIHWANERSKSGYPSDSLD